VPARRYRSLDGVRGLAAVVVVIHHALLTVPQLAAPYFGTPLSTSQPGWWLVYTPFHLIWAGTEAVYLFFVLSGIVLMMPLLSGRVFHWLAYYARRILRLYMPVIAAVIFGAATIIIVGRSTAEQLGPWMTGRSPVYTLDMFLRDITLVGGTSGGITPLWSLQWEVIFSLALPLYALIVLTLRRLWWVKLGATLVLLAIAPFTTVPALFYLPMFLIGALLAVRWERVRAFSETHIDGRRGLWPAIALVAVLMTVSTWMLRPFDVDTAVLQACQVLPVVGVAMLILCFAFWSPMRAFAESRLCQWLGTISFSLYLVHEPIIVGVRVLTETRSPWLGMAISIPLAFLVAVFFARFVERPTHALARRVGAGIQRLTDRDRIAADAPDAT
jgi:peptidoglycan/LPS O-acetylase OafA/YrhL